MKKGFIVYFIGSSICMFACTRKKKMQQRVIEWKLTALVLTGLLVVALAHKCILATMMVKLISENVLLRHLTLL